MTNTYVSVLRRHVLVVQALAQGVHLDVLHELLHVCGTIRRATTACGVESEKNKIISKINKNR